MPVKRSASVPKDALVWDLTLCARRALKRAARAQRLGKHLRQSRGVTGERSATNGVSAGGFLASAGGQGESHASNHSNSFEPSALCVSHDSLSLKYGGATDRRKRVENFAAMDGVRASSASQALMPQLQRSTVSLPALGGRQSGAIRSASGGTFATISPSRPQQSDPPNTSKRVRRVPSKRETLEKLKTSPFFVSSGYPKPEAIHTDMAHLMCSPEPSGR